MDEVGAERFDRTDAPADLEGLRQALDDERRRHLRLRADFGNFRRRVAQEHDAARQEGRPAALLPLLAVLDTPERALAAGSTVRVFYEGVGRAFDPQVHEAVATVPSGEVGPATVAREVRRGFRIGNELLRPAQVVVATGPEPADSWR
jgi:molecular chaperone GrpE